MEPFFCSQDQGPAGSSPAVTKGIPAPGAAGRGNQTGGCRFPVAERLRDDRGLQGRGQGLRLRGFRGYLRKRGISHTILEKRDQQCHRRIRGRDGGRPPRFDRETYRRRNTIERRFNRLRTSAASPPGTTKPPPSCEAAAPLASFLL